MGYDLTYTYIGSQRIVSKISDFASYGPDPRRIQYAGSESDAVSVDYAGKYSAQQEAIKENYATFDVPYNGTDHNDFESGEGFFDADALPAAGTAETSDGNFQEHDSYENLQFYYHSDHLGSSSYITNLDGEVVQHLEYVPFGEVFIEERNNIWNTPYLFNAKEFDEETGLYYYGARYYDPKLSLWMSTDPMEEKYIGFPPYCYTLNNPVKNIDYDGRDVKPAGAAELMMIQNTLPKEARDYVRLDKNGFIDQTLLNSYSGKSLNFNNLKTMVNSDKIVEVVLDDKFTFMGQDGKLGTQTMSYAAFDPMYDLESDKDLKGETINGLSTGESGFMGKTLFPDKDGIQNSPNGNIIVIVNKNLSPAGAAEIYSHEANGHALLYIKNGGDHTGASHQPINEQWIDGNKTLVNMIINSKKETIKNMQEK